MLDNISYKNYFSTKQSYNFNIIKYLGIINSKEYKAYTSLYKCFTILKNLNKTTVIFTDNFLTIICKDFLGKNINIFKFKNNRKIKLTKIFSYIDVSIFINISYNYVNFKLNYSRDFFINIDCSDCTVDRVKINSMQIKMYLLILYNLI